MNKRMLAGRGATRKEEITEAIHGKTVSDPYRWLEDEHAPEVVAWMNAQDQSARRELAGLPHRAELEARIKQLFYFDSITAPIHRGGRYFYARKHADREKSVVYWKQGEAGPEQVLFDPNTWSDDGSKGLHGWYPSYDGKLVAYQVSEHNSDETEMHILSVDQHQDLPEVLGGTKYASASWAPDSSGFYYTYVPPVGGEVSVAERPGFAELRFHRCGNDSASDLTVYGPTRDAKTFLGGGISRDGRWITAVIQHGWNSTDIYFRDARSATAPWQTLVAGVDANFNVEIWHDKFYIHTNDGAPRYRVLVADASVPTRSSWKQIVAQSDSTLESLSIVGGMLQLTYLKNASSALQLHSLDGTHVRDVVLPGVGTSAGISGEPDEDTGYFAFTSFTEPQVIYQTSIETGATSEWARVALPIDTSTMVTDQVFFSSKDGTTISMFIVRDRTVERNGRAPTILYGYGGFNVSLTPGFSGSRIAWLERGGIYAIVNLRGGGEYGEDWHKAGMLLAKQNVFDDFAAAASYLIDNGWTSPRHLAAYGGSNGGLLVGAAITQHPERYRAAICAVPLLDMLRYQRFGSGQTWIPEYGSPDDPQQFATLYAYSPYRVAVDAGPRAYPAVLFDSADHDDRVDPMHARKMTAVLQAEQTSESPILLRIERNSGHGGADLVKSQVDRVVDQLAFLVRELGQ